MNADRAAELLQIPERGLDLLKRFEEDESIKKAITAVQSGFAPTDVASMYGLSYDDHLLPEAGVPDGSIHVYECQTRQCKQKGRVATCSLAVDEEGVEDLTRCPGCNLSMVYIMSVEDEGDISLRRTRTPKSRFHDEMHGVDKSSYTRSHDVDD